jgi:hypothetical protein
MAFFIENFFCLFCNVLVSKPTRTLTQNREKQRNSLTVNSTRFCDRLIDWLLTVLRPAQEFFTLYVDVTIAGEGLQNLGPGPLSREGSLSGHTCCDTGHRFFRSHPRDRPNQSPLTTHMGIYSNPDPHGANILVIQYIRWGGKIIDYLLFYVPLKICSLIWRRHHYRWRDAKFRLMLGADRAFEQGGIFIVLHLLWNGPRFFRSHSKDHPFQLPLKTHTGI